MAGAHAFISGSENMLNTLLRMRPVSLLEGSRRASSFCIGRFRTMLKKTMLGLAATASFLTLLPAEAEAHGRRYRSYDHGYYAPVYYTPVYRRPVYRGPIYHAPVYPRTVYRSRVYYDDGYYGRGYERPYYGRSYGYDRRYRGRCGSGTGGAIVGGAAGALLGREIARGGRGYYRRGGGTTGALIGGAAGALIGREIARSC
jgi:hypothetical protein